MAKPRSINGARKRGWHIVRIPSRKDLSWVGIMITIDRMITGHRLFLYDMQGGGFAALENETDASKVQFQFGEFG